jgi:phosphinothricin acetyltransferase
MADGAAVRGGVAVRAAEPRDVPAILAITNDAILHSTALFEYDARTLADQAAWFADKAAGGWPVLVADDGSGAVGFASYGPFRSRPAYAATVEHSIYVADGQRGRGVGQALMHALIAEARRERRHVMVGGIDASNDASIAFHAALGFVQVGRLPQVGWKFDRWLDLVFMQIILS